MERCKKCGQYCCEGECKPFKIYYPEEYGDEIKIVYGTSFEAVVEKIAEEINSDDPEYDTDIFETDIDVTDEYGVRKSFNCRASISVDYRAREEEG